jgi:uncharacterized membrane protein YbhN (UPF0104 family)
MRARDRVLRAAGVLVGAGCLVALVLSLQQAIERGDVELRRMEVLPLALAFALLFASHLLQATTWHLVRASVRIDARFIDDVASWAVSVLGKYLPGKVFHLGARLYLYKAEGRPAAVAHAYVVETVVTLTAAAIAALVALVVSHASIGTTLLSALAAIAVAGSVLLFATRRWLPSRVWQAWRDRALPPPRPGAIMLRFVALLVSMFSCVLLGTGLFLLASALHPVSWDRLPAFVAALSCAGLAGMLAFFVPAGLGVREAILALLLSPVIPGAQAALVAIASRAWFISGDLVVALAGAAALRCAGGRTRSAAEGPDLHVTGG